MLWTIIIAIFYQPFFNALILIYWALQYVMSDPDMGIAVILFTILIRILMLPLTLASAQSEKERQEIGKAYADLETKHASSEPLEFRNKKKEFIQEHRNTVRFEFINIAVVMIIAVVLWRIFGSGLKGSDLYLIYPWMPQLDLPFNLTLLGHIDLTMPNLSLNLMTAGLLFLVETLSLTFAPIPPTYQDRILQFLVPVLAFLYLYNMPAGKKIFLITTMIISVMFILGRETWNVLALVNKDKGHSNK